MTYLCLVPLTPIHPSLDHPEDYRKAPHISHTLPLPHLGHLPQPQSHREVQQMFPSRD